MTVRTGIGIDAHRFADGRKFVLGGVCVPFEKGLLGHSDADVLAHAVSDALLGAAALGDIGQHFPDTDPKWEGADSIMLLEKVCGMLRESGWRTVNIDATVMCEKPKLAPYIPDMRKRIASAAGVDAGAVSVKATTVEGMGAIGRREGVSAVAVATIAEIDAGESGQI